MNGNTVGGDYVTEGAAASNEMGVVVDQSLKVVDLSPRGAGERDGIKQGDILISVTLIKEADWSQVPPDTIVLTAIPDSSVVPDATPDLSPTGEASGAPLQPEADIDVAAPAPTAEVTAEPTATRDALQVPVPNVPVPFTETLAAKYAIGAAETVKVTLNRDGNVIEVTVHPTMLIAPPGSLPRTAVPETYGYF